MSSVASTSSLAPSSSASTPPNEKAFSDSTRKGSPSKPKSFLPTYAIDQAVCGLTAGIVSSLCMHPLDLVKVKFQVSTGPSLPTPSSATIWKGKGKETGLIGTVGAESEKVGRRGIGREMFRALSGIVRRDGYRGLYRGLSPNLVGNASSWGLYFLWYTMLKEQMNGGDKSIKLTPGQHLLASAQSGAITAVMTNPIWVVKTRMFTTRVDDKRAYRNAFDGLIKLAREEGVRGLSKGMVLALFGVSNGAIQFMTYEELKRWRIDQRVAEGAGEDGKNLSNLEYILMSGSSKLVAIGITYPYQVIRSRIQYQPPSPAIAPYTSIASCIARTYRSEGLLGFYKGLGTNAIRILPGTCVTFVIYEQLSRVFARWAT